MIPEQVERLRKRATYGRATEASNFGIVWTAEDCEDVLALIEEHEALLAWKARAEEAEARTADTVLELLDENDKLIEERDKLIGDQEELQHDYQRVVIEKHKALEEVRALIEERQADRRLLEKCREMICWVVAGRVFGSTALLTEINARLGEREPRLKEPLICACEEVWPGQGHPPDCPSWEQEPKA